MPIANSIVAALLGSPLHRLLSKSTVLVRYTGRRSGHTITTPTQYALTGPDVVILVGRPDTKTWWRNFRTDRDIDVLMRAEWTPMTAKAFVGTDEPEKVSRCSIRTSTASQELPAPSATASEPIRSAER